jgi:hypothetical protein
LFWFFQLEAGSHQRFPGFADHLFSERDIEGIPD